MLPLLDAKWYTEHPKPVNSLGNLNITILKKGLRIVDNDYD
jgi:hypothetical protein